MLVALLLAAGSVVVPAARTPDQRISLLEARQILQSQAIWTLQASVTPDAAKALEDLDLHLAQDRDREEKMAQLETQVATLERRLQSIELLLGDRSIAEGGALKAAPPQTSAMVLRAKAPQAKNTATTHAKAKPKQAAQKSRSDRMSAQQP